MWAIVILIIICAFIRYWKGVLLLLGVFLLLGMSNDPDKGFWGYAYPWWLWVIVGLFVLFTIFVSKGYFEYKKQEEERQKKYEAQVERINQRKKAEE